MKQPRILQIIFPVIHPILLTMCVITLTTSCNKESYIQGIGSGGTGNNNGGIPSGKGRLTLYCTNPKLDVQCARLGVSVDFSPSGTIEDRATSTPTCGANTSTALTLELDPGRYSLLISGSSTGCLRYNFDVTIVAGRCVIQQLN